MYLFYGDETNLDAKENEFFIYGGIAVPGDRVLELSHAIDNIRGNAAIEKNFQLKFKPKPENISHEDFNAVKQSIINTALQHGVFFLVSLILQNICTSISDARINEINRVFFHFDCLLSHASESGVVLIDRFQFAVNAFTRNESGNLNTAKMLIQLLSPLFVKNPDGTIYVLSLNFSPKRIKVPTYLAKYQAPKDFFFSCGLFAAQDIVSHRVY